MLRFDKHKTIKYIAPYTEPPCEIDPRDSNSKLFAKTPLMSDISNYVVDMLSPSDQLGFCYGDEKQELIKKKVNVMFEKSGNTFIMNLLFDGILHSVNDLPAKTTFQLLSGGKFQHELPSVREFRKLLHHNLVFVSSEEWYFDGQPGRKNGNPNCVMRNIVDGSIKYLSYGITDSDGLPLIDNSVQKSADGKHLSKYYKIGHVSYSHPYPVELFRRDFSFSGKKSNTFLYPEKNPTTGYLSEYPTEVCVFDDGNVRVMWNENLENHVKFRMHPCTHRVLTFPGKKFQKEDFGFWPYCVDYNAAGKIIGASFKRNDITPRRVNNVNGLTIYTWDVVRPCENASYFVNGHIRIHHEQFPDIIIVKGEIDGNSVEPGDLAYAEEIKWRFSNDSVMHCNKMTFCSRTNRITGRFWTNLVDFDPGVFPEVFINRSTGNSFSYYDNNGEEQTFLKHPDVVIYRTDKGLIGRPGQMIAQELQWECQEVFGGCIKKITWCTLSQSYVFSRILTN